MCSVASATEKTPKEMLVVLRSTRIGTVDNASAVYDFIVMINIMISIFFLTIGSIGE